MFLEDEIIEVKSGLAEAAERFFEAAYKYREYLKRNHADRLTASIWIKGHGGELVLYTEDSRHANSIIEAIALQEIKRRK